MAKKVRKEGLNQTVSTLRYLADTIDTYGDDNQYNHDLMLLHIQDIVEYIKKDKELKEKN